MLPVFFFIRDNDPWLMTSLKNMQCKQCFLLVTLLINFHLIYWMTLLFFFQIYNWNNSKKTLFMKNIHIVTYCINSSKKRLPVMFDPKYSNLKICFKLIFRIMNDVAILSTLANKIIFSTSYKTKLTSFIYTLEIWKHQSNIVKTWCNLQGFSEYNEVFVQLCLLFMIFVQVFWIVTLLNKNTIISIISLNLGKI